MYNNNRNSSITKSSSLGSLSRFNTHDISKTSPMKNLESTQLNYVTTDRRKSIIPTPHRSNNVQKIILMNTKNEMEVSNGRSTLNSNKYEPYNNSIPSNEIITNTFNQPSKSNDIVHKSHNNHQIVSSNLIDNSDYSNNFMNQEALPDASDYQCKHFRTKDYRDNGDFDILILQHFAPYSGKQNLVSWLDETERKFNHLKAPYSLRLQAVSLLMEGEARRKYIKVRKGIRWFDDFYEFLLSQFDVTTSSTSLAETQQPLNNNSANELSSSSNTTEDNQREKYTDISNSIKFDRRLPTRQSNAESILGATNTFGEIPDITSEIDLANNSSITIKQTVNDLRSAIVGDLIKNPKIFRGEKDDVKKWIDEIEHLLDVAHIPDSNRLELISYLLRSDSLEWYKNNKSILSTWKIFTHEIKRAFTSSFREELAFKRLETYCQGENQSVRNFFNEILKLCAEADSTMSEETKLKTLLNKTKPSIQFEVRKKKPTSTAEFLEYAKEVEELLQLSNLTFENNKKDISLTYTNQGVPPTINTPTSTNTNPMNNSWRNYSQ